MVTADTTEAPASTTASAAPRDGATPAGRTAGSRFTIAGDVVARTAAKLPERERNALKWLHGYCTNKNLSHKDVAPMLKQPNGEGYSGDSLYHAFVGNRATEQLANLVEAIERFQRVEEGRAAQVKSGFIETDISKRIWRICRKALLRQRVAFIFGETQIGKTVALEAYQEKHNHGETKMFRFPAGGSYCETLRVLAEALDIPPTNSAIDLRRRIIDCFDSNMLLIADEIMESHGATGTSIKKYLRTLNFLREIHDRKKCGLVLCGTNVFRDSLKNCPEARNLRQLIFRGLPPLQIPNRPGEADLELFAKAYGLGPAPDRDMTISITTVNRKGVEVKVSVTKNPRELQDEQIEANGLGRWITILQEASDIASEGKRSITWGAVIRAWHDFEDISVFEAEAT